MKKLYSYDIFDTCLIRTCGEPKHVFDLLAATILGEKSDTSKRIDFTVIRMNAEQQARKALINNENEEITLEDIYQFCDFCKLTDIDRKAIMLTEIDIEESVLLPVYEIKNEIEMLAKQGANIAYISDMYLPKEFIERVLTKNGFYVNHNIFVSSEIKKTKSTGNLYDHILKKLHIKTSQWQHTGDNLLSDYRIPRSKGIKSKIIKNEYNQYEKMGKELLQNGINPNSGFIFSLSRAIRLSFPKTPNILFASTFVAPMFVTFVYKLLCDCRERGIKHLFFAARDGLILYHIALEFANQFTDISLTYLYVSRQALYMAGLNEISSSCIKESMPHLKDKGIEGILYELHIDSFDYSGLSLTGLDGEQIIDLLFTSQSFIEALNKKYREQNEYIIKYFEQEGLTAGNCAIVDVLGSRRCQKAINYILCKNNYPKAFAYYFEVTWCRITDYEPYLAMNYQENIINTSNYNRASQPLYEQFFAISNQKRTIEYQKKAIDKIEPLFEQDYLSDDYKQNIFETHKLVCIEYAKHYRAEASSDLINCIQAAQKTFAYFCYAPPINYLQAIEGFRCTGSGEANEFLLNKRNFIYVITHINKYYRWPEGQLIYSSGPLYKLILYYLKKRYKKKK